LGGWGCPEPRWGAQRSPDRLSGGEGTCCPSARTHLRCRPRPRFSAVWVSQQSLFPPMLRDLDKTLPDYNALYCNYERYIWVHKTKQKQNKTKQKLDDEPKPKPFPMCCRSRCLLRTLAKEISANCFSHGVYHQLLITSFRSVKK